MTDRRDDRQGLREALTWAISTLENYGDHHEWCATQGTRTVKPSEMTVGRCDCGFHKELAELSATAAWHDVPVREADHPFHVEPGQVEATTPCRQCGVLRDQHSVPRPRQQPPVQPTPLMERGLRGHDG